MKPLKRLNVLALSTISAVLCLSACEAGNDSDDDGYVVPEITEEYARDPDEEGLYNKVLGQFESYAEEARGIADDSERFVKYAEAEAWLLNSGVFVPTTTQGGNYAITRVAPHTVPYANWGNDDDRLKEMVVAVAPNAFLKSSERDDLLNLWKAARAGGAAYNPKAYLQSKGYSIATSYQTTYQTAPVTLDILNTSEQSDTEVLVNCIDGLVEYDNLGNLRGNIAIEQESGLPYELSQDGLTYTFHLRNDAKWYNANGDEIGNVTADDFVASFQHMLDAAAGLEYLVDGIVKNAHEYLAKSVTFDQVGVKAVDDYTLTYTLENPESFFPTRMTYSCFMPMNRAFFLAKGGAFGVDEYKAASALETYTYGVVTDAGNMVYNGAFIPGGIVEKSEIVLRKNSSYFKADKNNFTSLKWVYDDGKNPDLFYSEAVRGTYVACTLSASSGLLAKAKADGNFDKYHYISDTTTTTFLGALNVDRASFESGSMKSTQNNQEKTYTHYAMQNVFFRKAIQFAFDQKTWNAVSVGADVAALSLRNMYTKPDFVSLSHAVTDSHGFTFPQGTIYGDLVQHYCDRLGLPINVADGQDGWYNPDVALGYMKLAVKQLKAENKWGGKIKVDIPCNVSKTAIASANAFEKVVENVLGKYVDVYIEYADTTADYYAGTYRASNGTAMNFDVCYGTGWGPDYGDPSTYLDTFASGGAGYMTKLTGLY